jgi:hypothetical protein
MASTPYNRQASFVGYESSNPSLPKRGTDLDAEFDALKVTSDSISASLSLIQRDDGALRNESVHPDALGSAIRAILAAQGGNIRGPWASATVYAIRDIVGFGGTTYLCAVGHTSTSTFANDQAGGAWLELGTAGGGGGVPGGPTTATNVSILDAGSRYASSNVEGALQEAGASISHLNSVVASLGNPTASNVLIADAGNNYAATTVEAALAEIADTVEAISAGGAVTNAAAVTITDATGYYDGSTVEAALAEIGADLQNLPAAQVLVADAGNNYTGGTVEAVLSEIDARIDAITGGGGATTAVAVSIADAGSLYDAVNVETALQEARRFRQTGASADRSIVARFKDTAHMGDFGTLVADNATNNATTFNAALASTFKRFYLPEGTYYVGISPSAFTKQIIGPGLVRFVDGTYTRGFAYIGARPDPGFGAGTIKFATAANTYCDMREVQNYAPRVGFSEAYNAPELSMRYDRYINQSGTSGNIARLAASVANGATTALLNSTDGLTVGRVINFGHTASGATTGQKTITNISGNTITFTPAVETLTHPQTGAVVTLVAGNTVGVGNRTMTAVNHYEFDHGGGGDAYINKYRVYVGGTVRLGEDHVYMTKTGGIDGGDMIASADGVYMTGREVRYAADKAHPTAPHYDIAVAAEVHSLQRNNITGGRNAFWIGSLYKSDGEIPGYLGGGWGYCDAAHVIQGYWRRGLDFTTATITAEGGAFGRGPVINMGADQRIYWDSGFTPVAGPLFAKPFSSFYGDTWTGYDSVASSWDVTVDGTLTARFNGVKSVITSRLEVQQRLESPVSAGVSGFHNPVATLASTTIDSIGSATYTPTITPGDNIAAAANVGTAFYTRVGRVVRVSGTLTIDPSFSNTNSTVAISLPIAADLTAEADLSGMATGRGVAGLFGQIFPDISFDRAVLQFNVPDPDSRTWKYEFSYLVK